MLLISGSLLINNYILGSQCEFKTIANIQGIPDKLCGIYPKSVSDKSDVYFAWVELITKFVIPFPLQLLFNVLLIVKLKLYTRKFNLIRSSSSSSSSQITK